MEPAQFSAVIHVRSYKPLRAQFPAPGVYRGKILIVLPPVDPSVLSRLAGEGEPPICIELELDPGVTVDAAQMRGLIVHEIGKLRAVSAQLASPVRDDGFQRLRLRLPSGGKRKRKQAKLIDVDSTDLLEPPPD